MSRLESFATAVRFTLATWILCGLAYPAIEVAINQVMFPFQANGSLVQVSGKIVGSRLIGQRFLGARWFHGRPSAVNDDPLTSGGSNLGPMSRRLKQHLIQRSMRLRKEHPGLRGVRLPSDMITSSGSGLDPDISPANAYLQARWIARARGLPSDAMDQLIARHLHRPLLGLFGEPYVNVLTLNLALMKTSPEVH